MTVLTTSHRLFESTVRFDVRCSAVLAPLDQVLVDSGLRRCQLFAGHEGPHVLVYARGGQRKLRTWRSAIRSAPIDVDCDVMQRPWMRGFPVTAWFETPDEPDR